MRVQKRPFFEQNIEPKPANGGSPAELFRQQAWQMPGPERQSKKGWGKGVNVGQSPSDMEQQFYAQLKYPIHDVVQNVS
jgi:hypothetical protein